MSAVLAPQVRPRANTAGGSVRVTQTRVLLSEWTKFRSLRSTMWTLLAAVVLTVGIGALFSAVSASQYATFSAADQLSFDPITTSLNGSTFSQLAVGVLGVLLISGEYSTGMIRSSLTAVPTRLPMLWGKLAVFAGVSFTVTLLANFVTFFLGQALLSSHHLGVSITDAGALRAVFGAAVYLTIAGLIGVALGTLLRNTAAAISTFVGVFFLLPPLTQLLPASWTSHFVQYLPSNAGSSIYGGTRDVAHALSAWSGFAVLVAYALVLVGVAARRLKTVDA